MTKCYTLTQRTEDLTVVERKIIKPKNGSYWVQENEILARVLLQKCSDAGFKGVNLELCLTGVVTLNRDNILLLSKVKRVTYRDLPYPPPLYVSSYYDSIKRYYKNAKKGKFMNKKEFTSLIEDILWPVAEEIGLPSVDAVKYSWTVTEEAVDETDDPECKEYLRELLGYHHIFLHQFEEIASKIKTILPSEADHSRIIDVIQSTKSTDHLAILAITEEDDKLFIKISNDTKCIVKLDVYKFLHLIKTAQPTRLYEFRPKRYQNGQAEFEMTGVQDGVVFGKFFPKKSQLEVVVVPKEVECNNIREREFFFFESSYLVSIYHTLTQLDKDKRAFDDRVREASTARPEYDPFPNL